MSYESIDKLQQAMARDVFVHSKDAKKAAGRALGTILESLTYFLTRSWGLNQSIAVEQRLPEFGNPEITHNVEFSLHSRMDRIDIPIQYSPGNSLSTAGVRRVSSQLSAFLDGWDTRSQKLISADGIQTNCAVIHESEQALITCQVEAVGSDLILHVNRLRRSPYAMFECKRVGVEEGQKKGPTTIEKAKQGAYVAASLSSIRKIANPYGQPLAMYYVDEVPHFDDDYFATMRRLTENGKLDEIDKMIITVGVVSNHGNWFTRDAMNKEMKILQGSYDWLLFLKDAAMAQFITDTILNPSEAYEPIQRAFLSTYSSSRTGGSRFTKKTMDREAYVAMAAYFSEHQSDIESWFEVLSEGRGSLSELRDELQTLDERIHQLYASEDSAG